MLHIAICEDNPIHNNRLMTLLEQLLEIPHSIKSFSNAEEFCKVLQHKDMDFDLIFMDIELGDGSGIEITGKINSLYPEVPIIFISQYLEYISEVYETEHIYFINKKAMDIYLPKALNKALKLILDPERQYLTFTWKSEKFIVPEKDILYLERQLRTTVIYTSSNKYYSAEKLIELKKRLNNWFVICHRSYLVNLKVITRLDKTSIMIGEKTIPVSRAKYEEVKKSLSTQLSK